MKATLCIGSIIPIMALTMQAVAAAPPPRPLGTALIAGPVFLNGSPVHGSSLTLAAEDRLETGPRGGVILTLSRSDGLVMSENSRLTLRERQGGVSAELERGRVLVSSSHRRLHEVRLAGEAVSIRASRGKLRRYQVSRIGENTYVLARDGSLSVFDEGYATHTKVPEGRVAEVRPEAALLRPPPPPPAGSAPQRPAAAGTRAGQISAAIPKDFVVRAGSESPGNRGDTILWKDLVRTEVRGRVRLALDDGSILNVGSNTRLQVIQHDNRTQQTDLQLRYGRMRAQVVRLVKPNARFEVRTNTAVCGVIGTDFYIEATETTTRVVVFKGIVRVTPLLAGAVAGVAAGAGQAVSAGQSTTAAAGSVSAPTTASVAQVQGALTATQTTAAAAAATQAATAAVTASRVTLTAVVPAAAVTAVAVPTLTEPASPSAP